MRGSYFYHHAYGSHKINNDDFNFPLSSFSQGRRLELSSVDKSEWETEYTPVRHKLINYTSTAETALFPSVYTTEPFVHTANLTLVVDDRGSKYKLKFGEFFPLKQTEHFQKNMDICRRQKGYHQRQNKCIHYQKVTAICLTMDWTSEGESTLLPETNSSTNFTNNLVSEFSW